MGAPTKPDALRFLRALQSRLKEPYKGGTFVVRGVIRKMRENHGMPEKRCLFLLSKWEEKGWYDYGTVLDGGWLTEEGMSV